jgi:hypothetical protein
MRAAVRSAPRRLRWMVRIRCTVTAAVASFRCRPLRACPLRCRSYRHISLLIFRCKGELEAFDPHRWFVSSHHAMNHGQRPPICNRLRKYCPPRMELPPFSRNTRRQRTHSRTR